VVLASDYLGVRPLYYYSSNDCIAWSSDLSQLVSWFGVEDDFDNHYIAAFLTLSPKYDRTIYRPISFVPCAHVIRAGSSTLERRPFWQPPVKTIVRHRSDADYEELLVHAFREAVLSRLRTNHDVCCDLSGGLDSSSVTCMVHHLIKTGATSPKRLATLSHLDPAMDDCHYIEIMERHCRGENIHLQFSRLLSLDTPPSPLPLPSHALRRERAEALESRSLRVHLTGLAGDLVMGNMRDDFDQIAGSLSEGAWLTVLRDAYRWSRAMNVPIWSALRMGLTPFLPEGIQKRCWYSKARELGQAYGQVKKKTILNQAFILANGRAHSSRYHSEYRTARPEHREFWHYISNYQITRPLIFRIQQFEPVKSTHPYCDRRLVELVAALPRGQLCKPGRPRDLMRRAFSGLLPTAVRNRRTKALGGVAIDTSILDILPGLLQSRIYSEEAGYVNADELRRVLRSPQATGYDRNELNRVLTLEIWLRTRHNSSSDNDFLQSLRSTA
jgi:asparagine synthase (glutamine-hydrolysing)